MAASESPPKEVKVDKKERKLTEALLDYDEKENESEQLIEVLTLDHLKKVNPWEQTIYHPKFAVPKKKKGSQTVALNEQSGNDCSLGPLRFNTKSRLDLFTSDWRTAVEPSFYHYVSNNGMYRATKCFNQFNLSLKKSSVLDKITPEQYRIQREIQQHFQETSGQKPEPEQKNQNHELHREKPIVHKERTIVHEERFRTTPMQQKVDEMSNVADLKKRKKAKSPVELPPIGVPLVNHTKNRDNYFSTRLIIMEEELNRDTALRHVLSSPDLSARVARSRSEPPTSLYNVTPKRTKSASKRVKNVVKDQCQSDGELREIAAKYNNLMSSKQEVYSKDDMDVFHVRPLSTKNVGGGKTASRNSRIDQVNSKNDRISDEKTEDKSDKVLTHHVRFTTATGQVVNIPKFGQYTGDTSRNDGKPDETERAEQKQIKCIDSTQKGEENTEDNLHGVIHTTHYVTAPDFYRKCTVEKISSLQSQFFKTATDLGAHRAITNGFHSVAVGKSRHRDKLENPMLVKGQELPLPEIAGRGVVNVHSAVGKFM